MMLGVSGAARQAITAPGLSGTKRANTITSRPDSHRNLWIRGARLRQNALFQVLSSGQYGHAIRQIALGHRTSSECVFPGAKLREHGHPIRQIAPGMARRGGANRGLGRTQKWIGRALLADARRQRRLAAAALGLLALQAGAQCRAWWLNGEREA